ERGELSFGNFAMIEQSGDQHSTVDLGLAYGQLCRINGVLRFSHPLRPTSGLLPAYDVIACAEVLPAPKISRSRPVLLEHHVDTARLQPSDEEVVTVQGIGQHHVSGREGRLKLTQQ